MNSSEIDKIFEKMRSAAHGSLIKFDATGSGEQIEGIIFEPLPERPPGFEPGVFVNVPSDEGRIYYFDPEASKEQGRLIIQILEAKGDEELPKDEIADCLQVFDHIKKAPEVKEGGGATGDKYSKATGKVDLG